MAKKMKTDQEISDDVLYYGTIGGIIGLIVSIFLSEFISAFLGEPNDATTIIVSICLLIGVIIAISHKIIVEIKLLRKQLSDYKKDTEA